MAQRRGKLIVLLLVGALCLALGVSATAGAGGAPEPQRRSRSSQRRARKPAPKPAPTPVVFSHASAAHSQLDCSSCHKFPSKNWNTVRTGDDAFPDITEYPDHASCLDCHRQQFFARERPAPRICSVCHVGVTPRNTARLPFPNPADAFRTSKKGQSFTSGFRVYFPHDKHLELMGWSDPADLGPGGLRVVRVARRAQDAAKANAVCANCHTTYQPIGDSKEEYVVKPPAALGDAFWLKKGTFKTSPDGHAGCFTCHSVESELKPLPTDCGTCHKLAAVPSAAHSDFDPKAAAATAITDPRTLEMWRRRNSSATFIHEGGLHTDVACSHCHDVTAMNTADEATTRVRVQSCGGSEGCHITATADEGGALNFELESRKAKPDFACAKCHIGYATSPVPQGHVEAIAKVKPE